MPLAVLWATTAHDTSRFRADRAQADRTELRAVLDETAAALDRAERESTDLELTIVGVAQRRIFGREAHGVPDPKIDALPRRAPDLRTLRRHLLRQANRLSTAHARLLVRLGRDAPATEKLRLAVKAAGAIAGELLNLRSLPSRFEGTDEERFPPSVSYGKSLDKLSVLGGRYRRAVDDFIDQARLLAGSQIDAG